MYVIIKGRVACEVTSPDWALMPIVIATKKDGDQFGELSLLDQNDENSEQGDPNKKKVWRQLPLRTASCITTEETDCLCVDLKLSQELYKPKVT